MRGKVLITGSGGFVGSHTVEYFLQHSELNIVGFESFRHKGDSIRIEKSQRLQTFALDLSAPVSDRILHEIGDIDYIVNVASMSHVDTSISDPVAFWENNTKLIANILEVARKKKVKAFIQCSTDEVFGAAPDGYFHHEWDVILPSNPYAASKAAQEALCIAYWRTYGVPIVITNTMNMLGTKQDAEKFVPMLIQKISKGEKCLIHGTPGNIGSRMYLDCRNLADAWLYLLRHHEPIIYNDGIDHQRPSRYNVAGLEEIDNLTLAELIAKRLDKDLYFSLVDFHSTRPGHDRRYALDSQKILELGWRPPIKLEETLDWIIEWSLKEENKVWLQ